MNQNSKEDKILTLGFSPFHFDGSKLTLTSLCRHRLVKPGNGCMYCTFTIRGSCMHWKIENLP